MRVGSDAPAEETDPLPEGAADVVMVVGDVTVSNAARFSQYLPDDVSAGLESEGDDSLRSPSVTFEAGDRVPLPIARECWKAFRDYVAVLDENADRLDRASEFEEQFRDSPRRTLREFKSG